MSLPDKTATILVVDDEPDLLDILRCELEEAGYRVLVASSGNQAYDISQTEKIDLILTDIKMPNGSGHELLQRLKSSPKDSPSVLFMSGHADFSNIDAQKIGAGGLISKPWEPSELLRRIKTILSGRPQKWQRKSMRYSMGLNVLMKSPSYNEGLATQTLNIGLGGMFVLTRAPYPLPGEKTHFTFSLPNGAAIQCEAIVRWTRTQSSLLLPPGILPAGSGLEFVKMSRRQLAELSSLLRID